MSQILQIWNHLLWYLLVVEQEVGLDSWWGDELLSQSLAQFSFVLSSGGFSFLFVTTDRAPSC